MAPDAGLLRALLARVAEAVEVGRLAADRLERIEAALAKAGAPAPATDDEGLWDAKRTARYLGASASSVYEWAEAGTIPCLHVRGLLRFDPAEVKDWTRGVERLGKVVPIGGGRKA